MFGVLRDFRRLLERIEAQTPVVREALNGVAGAIRDLAAAQREAGPAAERLDALELHRVHFEADVEGLLLKADGKLKAAANAEARERHLKKSYDRQSDPFHPDSEEAAEPGRPVLVDDAPEREAERLHALRLGMAPPGKAAAIKAKWG